MKSSGEFEERCYRAKMKNKAQKLRRSDNSRIWVVSVQLAIDWHVARTGHAHTLVAGEGKDRLRRIWRNSVSDVRENLERLARGSHEIAQHGYVGAVGADASRIDRQTKPLGLIEIDSGVIELRQAETLCRQHAVQPRRIDRAGRTMPLPWPSRQFVELLPIAFVPSRHALLAARPV